MGSRKVGHTAGLSVNFVLSLIEAKLRHTMVERRGKWKGMVLVPPWTVSTEKYHLGKREKRPKKQFLQIFQHRTPSTNSRG